MGWALALVATIAPMVCRRRLMKTLHACIFEPELGRRLHWLSHALIAIIISRFIAACVAFSQINDYQVSFSLGIWGTAVAAIVAYPIQEMGRDVALGTEQIRPFV